MYPVPVNIILSQSGYYPLHGPLHSRMTTQVLLKQASWVRHDIDIG